MTDGSDPAQADADGDAVGGPAEPEPRGPYAYLHWREMAEVPPDLAVRVTEIAVFTDARVVGEPRQFGPYRLLNASAAAAVARGVPAVYLRVREPDERSYQPPAWDRTRADHYHGGSLTDEIAALLSLECGMRVMASDVSRREFRPGDDPYGRPYHFGTFQRPPQMRDPGPAPVAPALTGERDIGHLPLLTRLDELRLGDATALVKAARLYQNAAWLVESAPELAWLLLVSAVETAAVHAGGETTAVERLEAWSPPLALLLRESCGDEVLVRVADYVAPVTGATKKFVSFLQRFAALPAEPRPSESMRVDLSTRAKQADVYRLVYAYRSAALHAGRPFPGPMCRPPWRDHGGGPYAERPVGFAASHGTAVWRAEDIPLLLNTFAVLVRGALLGWWRSLLPAAAMPATAPPE